MRQLPSGTVTLLFTDIEGSTRLLHALGRDAYVEALEAHRRILREVLASHDGVEVEMQGDSFHYAFASAREAVAGAADAQRVLATHAWRQQPISVRIGIHTGEPAISNNLYAGLDVHRAARVMSAAHGGQVLVSETTERLLGGDERPLERFSLSDLGQWRLKDFDMPVRLYQVGGEGLRAAFPPVRAERVVPTRRRWKLASAGTMVVVAAAALTVILGRGGGGASAAPPNSAAEIDSQRNKLVSAVTVGIAPGPVAVGGGAVLVANGADRTLSWIEPKTNTVERTVPLGEITADIALTPAVWLEFGHPLRVARLDANADRPSATVTYHQKCHGCSAFMKKDVKFADNELEASGIAFGNGSLWAVGTASPPNAESVLMRVDPATSRILASLDFTAATASGLAVGNDAAWVAARGDNAVWQISTRTVAVVGKVTVGKEPSDVAFGESSIWVTTLGDDSLWRVDAAEVGPTTVSNVIRVGRQPSAVAVGPDAVWVANRGDGTVSRIDPRTNKVVATIHVGGAPSGIAVGAHRVWVTIQQPQE
jgi:YVTN family beta-propeller protein